MSYSDVVVGDLILWRGLSPSDSRICLILEKRGVYYRALVYPDAMGEIQGKINIMDLSEAVVANSDVISRGRRK